MDIADESNEYENLSTVLWAEMKTHLRCGHARPRILRIQLQSRFARFEREFGHGRPVEAISRVSNSLRAESFEEKEKLLTS